MAASVRGGPSMLGLFEKRIDGDDSLMELARLRFRQAGLGAEMHAGTPEQLNHLLAFRPTPESPVVVHLPRDFSLLRDNHRDRIVEFASTFAGRILGLVLHDERELNEGKYVRLAHQMNARLASLPGSPMVFIEYAVGLEPAVFAGFFEAIRDLPYLSACLDSGHIGIWQARKTFFELHPGRDVCALKSNPPDLPALMDDVELATQSTVEAVLALVDATGQWEKPVHFHLHDGHPLSTFSLFGVSDHLSFLGEIPLPFEYRGRRSAPPMFGRGGLAKIVTRAVEQIGAGLVSFTLEIHPTFERMHLGEAASLFPHWVDKTNAEKMNHWLNVLTSNQKLLVEGLASTGALATDRAQTHSVKR
jgi:hypothetical protein